MGINLFEPTFRVEECIHEIRCCLENGYSGIGNKTVEFEEKWKDYTGLPYAYFLNSVYSGIYLSIKILKKELGWQDDDEIIVAPFSDSATHLSITHETLKAVYADVDKYLCLDPNNVRKKINGKTKAIIFFGIGGNTGQYKEIVKLCKKKNLKLIIDAAHMSGTRVQGSVVGKDADVIVYSFEDHNNLSACNSGMICFKDKKYDKLLRNDSSIHNQSNINKKNWRKSGDYIGWNYHGRSIIASIGIVQLKYLDQDNAYRRQIAIWYMEEFKHYKNLIKVVPIADGCESSCQLYIIEINNKEEVVKKLKECEIQTGFYYNDKRDDGIDAYKEKDCPNAYRLSKRLLCLPIHHKLTKEDVHHISKKVIKYASF